MAARIITGAFIIDDESPKTRHNHAVMMQEQVFYMLSNVNHIAKLTKFPCSCK